MRTPCKNTARRARGGFSLVETLVAIALLAVMSSMAAVGATQALRQRRESIILADAQTVAGTAAQVVADRLRYGRICQVEGGSGQAVILVSGSYGTPVCLTLDDDGRLIEQSVSVGGDGSAVRGTAYALLGEDAYSGLCLSDLAFELDADADEVRSVKVSLSVAEAGDDDCLWQLHFSVAPINGRRFALSQLQSGV